MSAQVACYQHIIDKYKDRTKWQIAIDMDEYPYMVIMTQGKDFSKDIWRQLPVM